MAPLGLLSISVYFANLCHHSRLVTLSVINPFQERDNEGQGDGGNGRGDGPDSSEGISNFRVVGNLRLEAN